MADTKISQLTSAVSVDGTEIVPILQNGANKKSTASALAATLPEATANAAGKMPASAVTKLAGIAANATANATDAQLRDRSTHTGTQSAATITGLAAVATSGIYSDLSGRPSLASVATSGAYADLSGRPTLGTAAAADTGTTAGSVVILGVGGKLPAVDGSLLTGLPASGLTSVGLVVPTGFSVSGSPLTSNGSLTVTYSAGYSLPTTSSQTNWDTAYSERLRWDGGSMGLNAATARASLGLGTAATTAATDYATAAQGTKADSAVQSVTGTAPIVSSGGATPAISISAATTSAAGSMSSSDKSKLDGIASGATANSSDATLLARSNHTGTQAGSTITGAYTAAGMTMATARLLGRSTAGTGAAEELSLAAGLNLVSGILYMEPWFGFACSDETTAITTGTSKLRFRMPFACTLLAVVFEAKTAPTGSAAVFDLNEAGTSVFSTNPRIDAGGTDSSASGTPAVISDSSIAAGAVMTVDFDQIGSTVAGAGIKMWINVRRTA